MKKVTIVVPIYNVEKYLRDCFESLLNQTSDDYVVLAINDGSPDDCDSIIKEYVQKYPDKIMGIKKKNGGYGSVLQVALKEVKTPYFMVCDPDDTLEKDAVETLLQLASISNADISIGAKTFVYDGSDDRDYDPAYNKEFTTLKPNTVYNAGTAAFDDLFFIDPSPHAKLYRKEVAEGIVFPEHVGYTDNMLFYISLLGSKKVIYTDKALANYLIDRPGNSMTDVRYSAMNGQILVFKSIVNQVERMKGVTIPDMFYYRMFESFKFMLYQTRRLACSMEQYQELLDYLGTYLAKLTVHEDEIKPLYKQYSKNGFVEKMRDLALINPKLSERTYINLEKKMAKEFTPKEESK